MARPAPKQLTPIGTRKPVPKNSTKPAAKPAAATATQSKAKTGLSGLSLRQLMKATPPLYRANAEEVIIKALKSAQTKTGLPGVIAQIPSVNFKGTKIVYRATLVGKEKGKALSKQKHIIAACECDNFKYYWEYALHHWGSAVIKYSNGEAPEFTNPGLQPGLCKHLYKLAETVMTHGY
jgi:hypothetical protein